MKRWLLAAGLLAAAVAPQAFAADLDDGEPPPPPGWKWRDGAYGYPHKGATPPPGYYDDDDEGPPPPYAKKYDDEDEEGPPSRKYGDLPPYKGSCVRSEQVRDRLTSLGWRDFHSGKAISQSAVRLRARRPSGRLFELRLDRCSGRILEARPLELSPLRPYYGYGYKRPDRPPYWDGYRPRYEGYMGPYAGRYGKRPPPSADWDDD
jgi:hypothetical protein